MATLAKIGWGAKFSLANASNVLTEFAEITGIQPPEDATDIVEATNFGSTGARREWISGLIDGGEGEFEMNYVPGSATDLLIAAAIAGRVSKNYKIVLPTTTGTWEITGSCIPMTRTRSIPIDDRMTSVFKIKFTGVVTEAAGV